MKHCYGVSLDKKQPLVVVGIEGKHTIPLQEHPCLIINVSLEVSVDLSVCYRIENAESGEGYLGSGLAYLDINFSHRLLPYLRTLCLAAYDMGIRSFYFKIHEKCLSHFDTNLFFDNAVFCAWLGIQADSAETEDNRDQ